MATNRTAEDRLNQASHALVEALVDRTIGAADRKVGALTDKLEMLSQNGGLPLPKVDGPAKALGNVPSGVGHAASSVASTVAGGVTGAVGTAKDKLSNAKLPSLPHPSLPHPSLPSLPHPSLPGLGKKGSDDGDGDTGHDGGSTGSSNGSTTKVTTIIEEIDVGAPVALVYDQWTEFGTFPSFMKKVENVDAVEEQRLKWKAQIWWSHREWEATILDQIPEERIVWRSEGSKGHVDGAVTFHELTPDLTKVILVLEYYPQGLFERTANIWRAQGRRVRAELQHFRRHVMAHAVLEPDQVHGWRGVIEDGEVVEDDGEYDARLEEEQDEDEPDEPTDEADESDEDDEEADDEADDEEELFDDEEDQA